MATRMSPDVVVILHSHLLIEGCSGQILSTTHLLAAVFRAANDYQNGRIRSRNVHSETVFALSPNNNVSDAHGCREGFGHRLLGPSLNN